MNMHKITTRKPWSDGDVSALLRVYYTFLNYQQSGEAYTKAPAVRSLAADLGRTKGSIEAKMMNVSAVLNDRGLPFVTGYKPLSNYNKSLADQVENFLS